MKDTMNSLSNERLKRVAKYVFIRVTVLLILSWFLWIAAEKLVGMGGESEEYAEKWSENLAGIDSLSALKDEYRDLFVHEFQDGGWIAGVCSDSHGNFDGGTIVLKDHTDVIRSFFGHVCGSSFLRGIFALAENRESESPDDIYDYLINVEDFREYDVREQKRIDHEASIQEEDSWRSRVQAL